MALPPSKTPPLKTLTAFAIVALTALGASAALDGGSAQPQSSRERVETELVTVRSTGFDPQSITRPHGPFILEVDNRSGQGSVSLRLDAERGGRLREVRVPRERLDWSSGLIDLPPGRYVLTEEGHPDWQFELILTPN